MSNEHDDESEVSEAELAEQERAMEALLGKTAKGDAAAEDAARSEVVLRGVQRKLRERSRGKFYGDGWSTSPLRTSYGLVALVMLMILAAAYFALSPTGLSG
ncbi:hypothetical protein LVJ94_45520 [Pendulispora rubella]|uniref:DUF3040 domain-containing protein n=1 Tax=Pendulispora rubella TaxID=2741070 RepID=A0ABZ2L4M4_9BACT